MRQRYTERLFLESVQKARDRFGTDYVQVSLDEYTDGKLRSLGAFVISSLDRPERGPYLMNIDEMTGAKNEHIIEFFEKSMEKCYPNGNQIKSL